LSCLDKRNGEERKTCNSLTLRNIKLWAKWHFRGATISSKPEV